MAASRQLGILRTAAFGVAVSSAAGFLVFACALNTSGVGQDADAGVDRDATVPIDGGGPDAGEPDTFVADRESPVDTGPSPDVTSDSDARDGAPDAGADVVDAGLCGNAGEPCCGGSHCNAGGCCDTNQVCYANGTQCSQSSTLCASGSCVNCGDTLQPCCAGSGCSGSECCDKTTCVDNGALCLMSGGSCQQKQCH